MPATGSFFERYSALALFLSNAILNINDIAFLEAVRQHPGATQSEICRCSALSRSTASRIMIKLLDLSLVAERLSRSDMRASQLRITSRGENVLFEAAHAIREENLADFAKQLAAFDEARGGAGLARAEAIVLSAIAKNPGASQQWLCKATGCKASSASAALASLRARGLAKTRPASNDRRLITAFATESGAELAAALLGSPNDADIADTPASNSQSGKIDQK